MLKHMLYKLPCSSKQGGKSPDCTEEGFQGRDRELRGQEGGGHAARGDLVPSWAELLGQPLLTPTHLRPIWRVPLLQLSHCRPTLHPLVRDPNGVVTWDVGVVEMFRGSLSHLPSVKTAHNPCPLPPFRCTHASAGIPTLVPSCPLHPHRPCTRTFTWRSSMLKTRCARRRMASLVREGLPRDSSTDPKV